MKLNLHTQIGLTTLSTLLGKMQTDSSEKKKKKTLQVRVIELLLLEPAAWRSSHKAPVIPGL